MAQTPSPVKTTTESRYVPPSQRDNGYHPNRVWVPLETRNVNGQWTFKTRDGKKYYRDAHGAIRRVKP